MLRINHKKTLEFINSDNDMRKAFKYYLEHNTSLHNGYHNLNHMMAMVDLIINATKEVNEHDRKIMVIAAIFHDINHSGGLFNDSVNVENALDKFISFYENTVLNDIHKKELNIIINMIRSTEFPYKSEPSNIFEQTIRECDNLCCFYDDFLTQVLFGIKEELRINDINELIDGEFAFLENSWSNLKLDFSKNLVKLYGDELKEILNNLKETINL